MRVKTALGMMLLAGGLFGQGLVGQLESQTPKEKATEVLGTKEAKEQQFVEELLKEEKKLPIFGIDTFNIDVSKLTPGPIDRESYLIAPGDRFQLNVWGDLNLRFDLEVSPDYYVYIKGVPSTELSQDGRQVSSPDIGRVYLGGLTLKEAEDAISREMGRLYASYMNSADPGGGAARVDLTPTQLTPVRFLIQGEVNKPGSYILHPSLANLVYAIAQAGGTKDTASLRKIAIRRAGANRQIDFYDFLLKGTATQKQFQIQPNDVILVPLKTKEVTVQGEVRRPAKYELREDETLLDVLEMAGGYKPSASLEKALILRTLLNEGLKTIDVNLRESQSSNSRIALQDQDIVNIFPTYLKRIDFVSVIGEGIALPGEYQLQGDMSVRDLVQEAGGLTGEAYLQRADLVRTHKDFTRYYKSIDLKKAIEGDPAHNLPLETMDQLVVYTVREIEGAEGTVKLSGHVKKPGNFTLYRGMRLFDLLFAKGGFQDTDFLKKTYVQRGDIRRIADDGATRKLIKFDLSKLLAGDQAENVELAKDDEIVIYSADEVIGSRTPVKLTGHVKRPGDFPSMDGQKLLDVLDVAGGFQDRDFRKQTFLERADVIRWVRKGEQLERQIIRFNLGSLLLGDDSQNHLLEPGDEIVVYSAQEFLSPRKVLIDGFVKKPGSYEYAANMTLADLLVQAGGLLEGAYAHAEISRIDAQSNPGVKKESIQVAVDEEFFKPESKANLPLKSNDHVFVRKHPDFEKQQIVEITGEVQFPGRYVVDKDRRISDLIQRAGGLKPQACARAAVLMRLAQEDRIEPEPVKPPKPAAKVSKKDEPLDADGQAKREREELEQEERDLEAQEEMELRARQLQKNREDNRFRVVFDLEKALSDPGQEQDLFIIDGDRIQVPRFENVVRVKGAVVHETTIAHRPGKNADYYIRLAGGLAKDAEKEAITITCPDGRELKKSGGILWFGKSEVEPMSVINVPAKGDPTGTSRENPTDPSKKDNTPAPGAGRDAKSL